MTELKTLVLAGPDPAKDGIVRWRCSDLRGIIAKRFEVAVHERTVSKLLRRMALSRLKSCPHNPKRDRAQAGPGPSGTWRRRRVLKNFAELVASILPAHAADKPLEVWFQDEARVGQQGTLTHVLAERGSRLPACATTVTTPPGCSVRCAPGGPWAPPWSCPGSAAKL